MEGLSSREAARRLVAYGPNEITRRGRRRWPGDLARQLVHPLALLLWAAAVLAWLAGTDVVAAAIVLVVVLNAAFAFVQERQAERAVEALALYLPQQAEVIREGRRLEVPARELVPGDLMLIAEGDRISADARVLEGELEVDVSALTGESVPIARSTSAGEELLFSGTSCTRGEARALVLATGMSTELGRIAALTERVGRDESPLELQVRRVAWLIAAVAVAAGVAFVPLGLAAGLGFTEAAVFAIGLLVANVPEGLLPTISLSLALGVRSLARRGALVKRLSAVETLGSTTVICTDKTGTLTENRMRVAGAWAPSGDEAPLARALALCSNAAPGGKGDPTELALLEAASERGEDVDPGRRERARRAAFAFDPALKLMSTVDEEDGRLTLSTKGAPEEVLARCRVDPAVAADAGRVLEGYGERGLRVLAAAGRPLDAAPATRDEAERGLEFYGLVALLDPPRPEVAPAVASCHTAGIRVIVVTGDYGPTALEIARRVGIADGPARAVTGDELAALSDPALDELLEEPGEIVFARSSPEAKLRITDSLRSSGQIVAMTGDGVNDAPALRRADIGVAMGRSGTDVAREAATMVLADDNFATIARAVEEGRRVYDNVRKFIFYIFVHATPEIVPFLLFALTGGLVPLPLTVLQILAIDLGTETLPALALGREPAEPGIMERPPRPRSEGVIRRAMLVRAWLVLGMVSAALALGAFFLVLLTGGWSYGADTSAGSALHHVYLQATTMTFLAIVVCQIGTAFAARTEHALLREIGIASNPLLLQGIAFELVFAAALVYLPGLAAAFGMAAPPPLTLLVLLPMPLVVWGVDELRRYRARKKSISQSPPIESAAPPSEQTTIPTEGNASAKNDRVAGRSRIAT